MITEESVSEISEKYLNILERVFNAAIKSKRNPTDIRVIAVSKTHPAVSLEAAYNAGIRFFGENYVREMADKYDILVHKGLVDIEWHFIGHLQSNKVKYLSSFVNYIHSVDSLKLANEISSRAKANDRNINILVQVNTSGEPNKSGCEPDDLSEIISEIILLDNINIKGLMTIGTFTDDEKIQRKEFSTLRTLLENVNSELKLNLSELSMGMTGDFETAIDEGATMIRIGTAIFGSRNYRNFG
ncbi:MAG: YggS family pyridoxal phosphate-dependent enzyme [Candidatus Kapaibacterium sp.]|jgi:pyridoxal phosphate enzyme (YggS family)|nr:YggS family pyridoxal phosphate-dependent enzyme [Candidatus Kapabacteria bacterium]